MKLPKTAKLNIRGFSHYVLLAAVMVLVGVGGSAYEVATHAATNPRLLINDNDTEYASTKTGPASPLFKVSIGDTSNQVDAAIGLNGSNIFYIGGIENASLYKTNDLGGNGSVVANLPLPDKGMVYTNIAWSEAAHKLVVTALEANSNKIYTLKPDGTGITKVFTGNLIMSPPVWSPNGKQLLVYDRRNTDGGGSYYTINAATKVVTRVPASGAGSGCPEPTEGLYSTAWGGNNAIICNEGSFIGSTNTDGTHRLNLYSVPSSPSKTISALAVSPNRRTIAFATYTTSNKNYGCQVYLMPIKGSISPKIVYSGKVGSCNTIDWSPGSGSLAFTTEPVTNSIHAHLYTVSTAGTHLTSISALPATSDLTGLVWSVQ